jgi:hypothetical protein
MTAGRSTALVSPLRRFAGGYAGFAVMTVALTTAAALILAGFFDAPIDRAAIRASAFAAIVIQLTAFRATRLLMPRNILAGIAVGAGLRFMGLLGFALLAQTVLRLPLSTALLSLVVFYFPSTLMEPLFLRS